MDVLALIPARGGSKSIPRKNILSFAGYPLIAYSIAAAVQSKRVTRVIVSTDDEEIASTARQYGAETPFLRPAKYAQDDTTDLPVFTHALSWLEARQGYQPDIIVQLRPTSPVRPIGCVDEAVEALLAQPQADSVRGVIPAGQNPHKMWRVKPDGTMENLLDVPGIPEPYNAPRQALPPIYWQTGHIDAIRRSTIVEKNSLSGDKILGLKIDPRFAVDIDTRNDWTRAEWLVTQGNLEMVWPGIKKRPIPEKVDMIVFDFDGVFTDNRVWVDQDGRESIAAYRSDSFILSKVREAGIEMMVLSKEVNPVVTVRCKKMKLDVMQGIDDKATLLKSILSERQIDPANVIYVGNDLNDVPCFPLVGCAVVVADAIPDASRQADFQLTHPGGHGAVRELCDLVLNRISERSSSSEPRS